MTVRCLMRCMTKAPQNHTKADGSVVQACGVNFKPPYFTNGYKPTPGNELFGEFTPGADFHMYITNPAAHEQFEVGKDYYVDFTPAPSEVQAAQ